MAVAGRNLDKKSLGDCCFKRRTENVKGREKKQKGMKGWALTASHAAGIHWWDPGRDELVPILRQEIRFYKCKNNCRWVTQELHCQQEGPGKECWGRWCHFQGGQGFSEHRWVVRKVLPQPESCSLLKSTGHNLGIKGKLICSLC